MKFLINFIVAFATQFVLSRKDQSNTQLIADLREALVKVYPLLVPIIPVLFGINFKEAFADRVETVTEILKTVDSQGTKLDAKTKGLIKDVACTVFFGAGIFIEG